jgi:hypothetical protein
MKTAHEVQGKNKKRQKQRASYKEANKVKERGLEFGVADTKIGK